MTRSHRIKRNERKPRRGRNGAVLEPKTFGMSKTVMIVEDNELNMKLFHDLLEAHGYHAIGTCEGMQALDLARKHRPDLILMDIQLPEVSGLEVTKNASRRSIIARNPGKFCSEPAPAQGVRMGDLRLENDVTVQCLAGAYGRTRYCGSARAGGEVAGDQVRGLSPTRPDNRCLFHKLARCRADQV
jgi:CheY-like chemotaxis protein